MWSPEDENSIPTAQERFKATEALDLLQVEIAQTLARADELELESEKARAEVEQLRHQATIRTAWLAPIRCVPDDVLSLIFIETCRQLWKSPLQLGAVCRRWRHVLIVTPRAWARIDHDNNFKADLLELWLSRCGAVGVHASMSPQASPLAVMIICKHKAHIQCLSFFNNLSLLLGSFPYLEQLRLGGEDVHLERRLRLKYPFGMENSAIRLPPKKRNMCILNPERFPKLTTLHLHSPSNSIMQAISQATKFPPLQELHIHVSSAQWLDIIRNCAGSLVTLVVEYPVKQWSSLPDEQLNKGINLPQLQHLHYIFKDNEVSIAVPLLHTPGLQSYYEYGRCNFANMIPQHNDLASVTSLVLERPCSTMLDEFPNLTTFELVSTESSMLFTLSKLATDAFLCPKLNSVKCVSAYFGEDAEAKAFQYLDDRRRLLGQSIEFLHESSSCYQRSGYMPCYTLCDCESQQGTPFDHHGEEMYIWEGNEEFEDDDSMGSYDDDEDEDEVSHLAYHIFR